MKHLSDEQVQKFRDRSLTAQEFFIVDDHLAQCDECREQFAGANDFLRLKNAFNPELDHLEFDQMAAWVDGGVEDSERSSIEEHLQQCSICSREVENLKAFRHSLSESTQADKIIPFKKKFSSGLFMSVASIAALLAVATTAAVFWFQSRVNDLQAKLKQAQSQNEQLQREIGQSSETNQTPQQNQAALILQDGQAQVRIEKDGRITATFVLSENEQKRIREVVENQKFDVPPHISKLAGRKEILMGDTERLPFSVISPVGTAVSTERPHFRWETLPGAQNYQVRVYDSEFREILQSPWIRESEWISPRALPAGVPLIWQVTAKKQEGEIISPFAPFPDAKFLILQPAEAERIRQIHNKYAGFHLILGVHFAQFGLLDDAEREFIALQKANPKSPEALNMLNSIRRLRTLN